MVKANGYGLGAVAVARALESLDPWGFGVASVEEGAALRAAGIARPILVVSPLLPDAIDAHLAHDLRPTIGDHAGARRLVRARPLSRSTSRSTPGCPARGSAGTMPRLWRPARRCSRDADGWEGVFTHFHSADTDPASATVQWDRFQAVLATLPAPAGSGACRQQRRGPPGQSVRRRPDPSGHLSLRRCRGRHRARAEARGALRARVVAVRAVGTGETVSYGATWRAPRTTTVATLAVGYADGFLRAAREGGSRPGSALPSRVVELDGALVPVVGRVTMDMTMVDAGEGRPVPGDVATIYGGRVSLDQQAAAAGTIAYELLTALGARVPRRYGREP